MATGLTEPEIIVTWYSAFDPAPEAGDTIIPRNYGRDTYTFGVNLSVANKIGFGRKEGKGGGDQDDDDETPYKLEFSIQVRNLFNRTNRGTPIGNLRSYFSESRFRPLEILAVAGAIQPPATAASDLKFNLVFKQIQH